MRQTALAIAGAALLALTLTPRTHAQDVQTIAAVVNDEIVSVYDVEQRLRLFLTATRIDDSPATRRRLRDQILSSLIDEKLQIQEAFRLNTQVNDQEIDRGVRLVEQQNNMKAGDLERMLSSRGIDIAVFRNQIRAEIAWGKLVTRRLQPSVTISDDEIDEVLEQLEANAGRKSYLLSEIFLPVDSREQENEVRESAERILGFARSGANFAELARQYSKGATAASGGDVGWVQPAQLPEAVGAALAQIQRRQISEPVRTETGYYIVAVRDVRESGSEAGSEAGGTVALKQVVFPVPEGAAKADVDRQIQAADAVRPTITSCDAVDAVAKSVGTPGSGDVGTVELKDLPDAFRDVAATLPIGQPSAPIVRPTGVHLLVVCARDLAKAALPQREDISRALGNTRLALLARRYLQDLRRDAVIDVRGWR